MLAKTWLRTQATASRLQVCDTAELELCATTRSRKAVKIRHVVCSRSKKLQLGASHWNFKGIETIQVKHTTGDEWKVSVKGAVTTDHRVRVTKKDLERLAQGRTPEELLQESFRFLLERESNSSILGSFDLPVIGSYFPEFEEQIRARLRQGR